MLSLAKILQDMVYEKDQGMQRDASTLDSVVTEALVENDSGRLQVLPRIKDESSSMKKLLLPCGDQVVLILEDRARR